ncbi:hypothetical protein [Rhodopila sp.]|jgi:hypothetical protein|uniref:hypothetical protein n=1 Tax=Rhodopila sp. TaxID=2480087 RepID=UPI002C061B5F|nr:hypothetical protein [Rhodopila sp.]HVZ07350.1 hypothetical protein [Rhodopila sp.]
MSETHTFIIIPYLLAFLLSVKRFYFRDSAISVLRASFLLALGSMALAGIYLVFGALEMLPAYSTVVFGILGVACLAVAVWQAFQL